jgi:tetrahydromethanopterin S-methyltransferase subunit C
VQIQLLTTGALTQADPGVGFLVDERDVSALALAAVRGLRILAAFALGLGVPHTAVARVACGSVSARHGSVHACICRMDTVSLPPLSRTRTENLANG